MKIGNIEVFYMKGDPPFICGVWGNFDLGVLEEISKDLEENPETFDKDGYYTFSVNRVTYDYNLAFELDLMEYKPIDYEKKEDK